MAKYEVCIHANGFEQVVADKYELDGNNLLLSFLSETRTMGIFNLVATFREWVYVKKLDDGAKDGSGSV